MEVIVPMYNSFSDRKYIIIRKYMKKIERKHKYNDNIIIKIYSKLCIYKNYSDFSVVLRG